MEVQACQDMRQWDLDLPEWGLTLAPKPTALISFKPVPVQWLSLWLLENSLTLTHCGVLLLVSGIIVDLDCELITILKLSPRF